jgi:predicted metal-dependent phosphoesterase TrpH
MIVDLHIHTNLGSICSQLGPEELLERVRQMGIDAICVTEHHSHRGANKMVEYAADSGVPVFRGVEIYTELGDMLVYGLKRETRYHLTTFEELQAMADEDGAVIVPAHPCRGWGRKHKHAHVFPRELLGHVTAIETLNGANTLRSNDAAIAIAEECGLHGTGGSDAHALWQVGKCVTVFERDIANEEELVTELREGRFVAAYFEDLLDKGEESA